MSSAGLVMLTTISRRLPYHSFSSSSHRAFSSLSPHPKYSNEVRILSHRYPRTSSEQSNHNLLRSVTLGSVECQRNFSRESLAYYLSTENPPIKMAQEVMESVHSFTGLPWWASIILTTVGLRTFMTVPLSVFTQHNSAKLELLQAESGKLARQLKAEIVAARKRYDWTEKQMHRQFKNNMKRIMQGLYQRENCHPLKNTLIAWVQIPLWVSMSLGLRNMSGSLPVKGAENVVLTPSLASEGCLWIPDLLVSDVTWILPVCVGVFNLLNIELFSLEAAKVTRFRKVLTNTLRVFSVVMVPIAASVPSCMALYWTSSSAFSLAQNLLFKLPSFRRLCKIPRVPSESQTPFIDLKDKAVEKYILRRKAT